METSDEVDRVKMFTAARSGDLDLIKRLVQQGESLEEKEVDGRTILYLACKYGRYELVDFLLNGTSDTIASMNGPTATPAAEECIDTQKPEVAVDANGDAEATQENHDLVIRLASDVDAATGAPDAPDAPQPLTHNGSTLLNVPNIRGQTPLLVAAYKNHKKVVELLLDAGAEIDTPNNVGQTPLHAAAERGRHGIVKLLCQRGADLNSKNDNGHSLLYSALLNKHYETAELLISEGVDLNNQHEPGRTALCFSIDHGLLDIANLIIKKGANIKIGMPLRQASAKGYLEVVKELLAADITVVNQQDPNHKDQTALHAAAAGGYFDIVKLLVEAGANSKAIMNNGQMPLHLACTDGWLDIAEYLLADCPEQIHGVDCNGFTPLHLASQSGNLDLIKLLLNYDPFTVVSINESTSADQSSRSQQHPELTIVTDDVNVRNKMGWTPLHSAANSGHHDAVKLLLENGADHSISDNSGWTPLQSASFYGHTQVIELLLEQPGCEPLKADAAGRTALFIAASQGHHQIVNKLLALPVMNTDIILQRDIYNSTPLCAAMRNGYYKTAAELLKAARAPLDTKDFNGKTLAGWVRASANVQLKDMFLDTDWDGGVKNRNVSKARGFCDSYCHMCMKHVTKKDSRYWCNMCAGGSFILCKGCHYEGSTCPGPHELVKVNKCLIH
ncbi:unnamed protein product [Clonostachys byssicola]|uniref:Uncharacterized protein n=1 Tax=Clonostachys byssicola TaxID=160290 RepID=A0A9N9XX03_9HYPO|nr:unnamed protein product [Clonostachys byssicola]